MNLPVSHWEGVADPAYLLAQLEELKLIAERSGLGTLEYLLEMAVIEARWQVQQKEAGDGEHE